ncbi:MAG: hypothetical protein AAB092_03470, partial [Chloroflexota bacterium]
MAQQAERRNNTLGEFRDRVVMAALIFTGSVIAIMLVAFIGVLMLSDDNSASGQDVAAFTQSP